MTAETQKWVDKAEGDWMSLRREREAQENPNYDDACFHAQQCIEKYLKAHLIEADISFPKIHDLVALLELALPIALEWDTLRPAFRQLKNYGVQFRYPGDDADAEDAADAFRLCESLRGILRPALGLGV